MSDVEITKIREEMDRNTLVAHYTTMEGIHGLIQSASGTGKELVLNFWASSIFALNDPNELVYGYDVIWDWLPEIEKEMKILEENKLSSIWGTRRKKKCLKFSKAVKQGIKECSQTPYVISFSNAIDDLNLFRLYSNDGNGVCVVFSYGELQKHKIKLYDVMYQLETNHAEYDSYSMARTVYKSYNNEIKCINDQKSRFSVMLKYIRLLSLIVAPFVKKNDYESEKEKRFFKLCEETNKVSYRQSKNGNVIPYIIQEIPVSTIKMIIVGPCADYRTVKNKIELDFSNKGVKEIPIEKSKTNYRKY